MEGMTKEEIRKRIERNLKEIQENGEAAESLKSQIYSLEQEGTDLRTRFRSLRDQVNKDLAALDPEMRL